MSSAVDGRIVIGVGHADRQDDGVGPHVARALRRPGNGLFLGADAAGGWSTGPLVAVDPVCEVLARSPGEAGAAFARVAAELAARPRTPEAAGTGLAVLASYEAGRSHVLGADGPGALERGVALRHLPEAFEHHRCELRWKHLVDRLADEIRRAGEAHVARRDLVHVQVPALQIEHDDGKAQAFQRTEQGRFERRVVHGVPA